LSPGIELEEFHGLSLNINLDERRVGFIDAWEDPGVKRGVWVVGYEEVSLDDVHWEQPDNFWDRLGFRGEGKRKRLRL